MTDAPAQADGLESRHDLTSGEKRVAINTRELVRIHSIDHQNTTEHVIALPYMAKDNVNDGKHLGRDSANLIDKCNI